MRRSAFNIVLGLLLAIVGAAAVLSGAEFARGAASFDILKNLIPVAAVLIPLALLAIWLAEIRRVRGLVFWLAAGALIAGVGYAFVAVAGYGDHRTLLPVIASGLAAGLIYWRVAGKNSGVFAAAIDRDIQTVMTSETAVHRRCWACVAAMLLVGAVPLALIGWQLAPPSSSTWPDALRQTAEQQANGRLADAGLPWATLKIENHVGRLTGTAPATAATTDVIGKANNALADMVGVPGVIAYLQNDLRVAEVVAEPTPVAGPGADVERVDSVALARREDRVRRMRLARGMTAAKLRRAQKLEAQQRDASRQVAERKLEQDRAAAAEANAAAEAARLRAADEEKRKAEATAANAALALEEQRRLDAVKRNDEEQKRLSLEADREKQAVAAARRAEAEKSESGESRAPSAQPLALPIPSPIDCDAKFAALFKAQKIQFARNASSFGTELETFFHDAAALAGQCAEHTIDIAGHADRTGSEAVNLATSLARAVAVRDALHARGIPASRLKAVGYGDSRPLDPSRNNAAFARNRRVEMSASRTPAAPSKSTLDTPQEVRAGNAVPQLKPVACHIQLNRAAVATPVRFSVNGTQIQPAAARALKKLAHILRRCSHHVLAINGHADSRGSIEANRVLSERRAHAVRDLLIERGVSGEQLSAVGHGALMPLIERKARAAYARNRRVDFDIAAKAPPPQ